MDCLHILFNLLQALAIYVLFVKYNLHEYIPSIQDSLFRDPSAVPDTINFHFTRKTRLQTLDTDEPLHIESLDNIKLGLRLLKSAGVRKINFAGGEPFLHPHLLRNMVTFCSQLRIECVSITTDPSRVTEKFMGLNGYAVDAIAVSCDSFAEAANVKSGRANGSRLEDIKEAARICSKYFTPLVISTVVNRSNLAENMNEHLNALQPSCWKVFQNEGENGSEVTKSDADLSISDKEFEKFCKRHQHHEFFAPMSNKSDKESALTLDEYMRFKKRSGAPTRSIFNVGVAVALEDTLL
ncbi:Elp3 [Aspergillus sp. HF37]|nr:Elp3 [Aspergillus sp. HF37]